MPMRPTVLLKQTHRTAPVHAWEPAIQNAEIGFYQHSIGWWSLSLQQLKDIFSRYSTEFRKLRYPISSRSLTHPLSRPDS